MLPEHKNHVWTYDFMVERTSDGRSIRLLNIVDEYTRECLRIRIDRKLRSSDVLYELSDLFIERGTPDYIRSDNCSEFTADLIRGWLNRLGVKTLFIEPGSPWENGYIESFNGKLRDELLSGEIFDTILEARVVTEDWRKEYNTFRPHSSLGYRAPAPEAIMPWEEASPYAWKNQLNIGTTPGGWSQISYAMVTTSVNHIGFGIPSEYQLSQNYPNPFNPSTTLRYGVPVRSNVTLTIFNTLGQRITQFENKDVQAGTYEQSFDASHLPSGLYFYRMEAASVEDPTKVFVQTRKMLLLK